MSKLVLWGHHIDDYREMFDLGENDLKGRILEYGCGPSAFNLEVKPYTRSCISCDPLFSLDASTLKTKTSLVFEDMIAQVRQDHDKYNFADYGGLDGLIEKRRQGMNDFFSDFEQGKKEKRYQGIQNISLPFDSFYFDLALSSHYLFAGLDNQNLDFHMAVIQELTRVAKELRVFPLIDRFDNPSPLLGPVLLLLQQKNYGVEVRTVPYHLQDKGNVMLRVWAQECEVQTG
ncbi:hypothetical protein Lbir_1104 [Legionella birminghamensis]|uniref:SAM-dependent methyltransferase n=1 Tax=Legionella birminghamensis TaxID=28083 RepID=A0A378ICS8_9GAMM|nr:hypothetical protein [Legionella birminghamensis]KTC73052.1 hypothetical protein Lbir_1104 [Legionella birminghamensis]STX32371.1 SAM-dependent methyltransferase [Legionella birminghamensis]